MQIGLLIGAILVGLLACPAMMWWQRRRGQAAACCAPGERSDPVAAPDPDELAELRGRHAVLSARLGALKADAEPGGSTLSRSARG